MFPDIDLAALNRMDALQTVLMGFAYRFVWFDRGMAKAFYSLPEKDLKAALAQLEAQGALLALEGGYIRPEDQEALENYPEEPPQGGYAFHRNDPLFKVSEAALKAWAATLTEGLPYDCQPLQFLLIDGEFRGVVVGHFRNGPHDLNDVRCDLPDPEARREEILEAVRAVNFGKSPARFMGMPQGRGPDAAAPC